MNDEEQICIDTVLASYVNKIEINEDGVYYDGKEYLSKDELVYLQDIEIIFEDYGLDKDRYEVFVAILRLAHEVRNYIRVH